MWSTIHLKSTDKGFEPKDERSQNFLQSCYSQFQEYLESACYVKNNDELNLIVTLALRSGVKVEIEP